MSNLPEFCFECGEGEYFEVKENYRRRLSDGEEIVIPDLKLLRCNICGEDIIPPESSRLIESYVEQYEDVLPPTAIFAFLEQFHVTQAEAAEALGMGAKTFHRWARGTQRVSRSMGYFLRALMAHPTVFEWIRDRGWRNTETAKESLFFSPGTYWAAEPQVRFPALSSRTPVKLAAGGHKPPRPRFNAAQGLLSANVA